MDIEQLRQIGICHWRRNQTRPYGHACLDDVRGGLGLKTVSFFVFQNGPQTLYCWRVGTNYWLAIAHLRLGLSVKPST